MNILLILNDPPYGTERSYNGLRLAKALANKETAITVFLLADGTEYPYDFLVIATGHRSANEAVPGLGPFDGPSVAR